MEGDEGDKPVITDYQPSATWSSDFQVLKSMIFADVRGSTQQERCEFIHINT
jgi:hypothetical protein